MPINPRNFRIPARPPWPVQLCAFTIVLASAYAGKKMDDIDCWRMTRFRDKSKLFEGRNPDPENNPSWGPKGPYPYRYSEMEDK